MRLCNRHPSFRSIPSILLAAAVLLVVSCGRPQQATNTGQGSAERTGTSTLNGAGATFPAPLYAQWADAYRSAKGVEINYAAIGSGGGINQIAARTVDFGASDDPLKIDDLRKRGLIQFPAIIGGVVVAYNLPGFSGELKLDGPTVADIFLGKVKSWDDPRVQQLNPGTWLPHTAITPVYRSDGSGTSFIFTTYLSRVSPVWQSTIGADKSVNWPTGVGGKGNPGVAGFLMQIGSSIGYVEYSYAESNSLSMVTLTPRFPRSIECD